jgi:preprotein translocase subunit SecD
MIFRVGLSTGLAIALLSGCASSPPTPKQCEAKPGSQLVRVSFADPKVSEPTNVLVERIDRRLHAARGVSFVKPCPALVTEVAGGADVFLPPGSPDLQKILKRRGVLEFRTVVSEVPKGTKPADVNLVGEQVVMTDANGTSFVVGSNEIPINPVDSAVAEEDRATGGFWIRAKLTNPGSIAFDSMATRNYNKRVAVVLDGVVLTAPNINAEKFRGEFVISGNFTQSEAEGVADSLNGGPFPVEIQISRRT